MPDPLTVFAVPDVKLKPKADGLPGSEVLQSLVNGLAFWGLLAALAALVVGAAVWGWASQAHNHQYTANGRRAAGLAALAALLIGAAPALINFFADAGEKVK
jgi:MFS family permease